MTKRSKGCWDGQVDARGRPNLLQAAVALIAYPDTVVFVPRPPLVQRSRFGGLAPLGRLPGKQPVRPEHLFRTDLAEPQPEASSPFDG